MREHSPVGGWMNYLRVELGSVWSAAAVAALNAGTQIFILAIACNLVYFRLATVLNKLFISSTHSMEKGLKRILRAVTWSAFVLSSL